MEYDSRVDYARYQYIHPYDEGDVFTVFIALCHRNEFSGGDIIINKRNVDEMRTYFEHDGNFSLVEKKPLADEEEEEYDPHYDQEANIKRKRTKYSELSRVSPEMASVLVVRSDHEHGTLPVEAGLREVVTLQFWRFADASVGSREPLLSEGEPLPSKGGDEL
jgi:hypothetical protein